MARRSTTEKALADTGLITDFVPERPAPIPGLTREQREEWREVVDRMPEDWFPRESHQLLAQYCRHACEARRISGIITAHVAEPLVSEKWLNQYDQLLKMQEREGRAMSSLATRLRITQQLACPRRGTVYRALSKESKTALGLSPLFSVHDELGQVRGPRSPLYEAIETASGAQDQPLSIIISTQAETPAPSYLEEDDLLVL